LEEEFFENGVFPHSPPQLVSPSQAVEPHLFREVLGRSGDEVLGFGEEEYVFLLDTVLSEDQVG
jgi:hypothetical protein